MAFIEKMEKLILKLIWNLLTSVMSKLVENFYKTLYEPKRGRHPEARCQQREKILLRVTAGSSSYELERRECKKDYVKAGATQGWVTE